MTKKGNPGVTVNLLNSQSNLEMLNINAISKKKKTCRVFKEFSQLILKLSGKRKGPPIAQS